ncbi:glutamate mutase L [Candidatus Formimonas warabiya]|uniref:MutL protein n=1 Tax=Formimonas warabiya TaxID=1761012 RepID=A0A3G1KN47_FORW1|nr:glutamate mutase L [Candidatus Formimonas warabiya]ATW23892.1 hypothetical protein DCMF_02965 [Candidatus Formimonas warabiya]
MRDAILIDFGSTFTKVVAASGQEKRILFTACFPSTVKNDARIGLFQCLDGAKQAMGEKAFSEAAKLASSSAAGGLRMAVVGLSKTLSITAGRNTAFGAGAKILKTFSGRISAEDAEAIVLSQVEIVLFCGGYEKGNTSMILHNAEVLANSEINVPVIYAGNSSVAKDVRRQFVMRGKECYIVSNIIPQVGELDTAGAEEIIRDVFMKRIVNMKGLDRVSSALDAVLMPTPAAVLSAGELLSRGWGNSAGLGPLMIVDIGGATTDIHSYAHHTPYLGAKIIGAQEAYARRTVEGDLGMRESSDSLAEETGWDRLAQKTGLPVDKLKKSIEHRVKVNGYLADSSEEVKIDGELACAAARISARRHTGVLEHVHSGCCKLIQKGKNLTEVNWIIGTGGPIIHSENPWEILQGVLADRQKEPDVLLPEKAQFFLDADYVLYAVGLLKEIDPQAALEIVKKSIKKI